MALQDLLTRYQQAINILPPHYKKTKLRPLLHNLNNTLCAAPNTIYLYNLSLLNDATVITEVMYACRISS
jgi:hypothetical protein